MLKSLKKPANRYWLALIAIIMVAGYFFFMGYTVGYEDQTDLEQRLYSKSLAYNELTQVNKTLKEQNQTFKSNLQVEQDTRKMLQKTLMEQTRDLYAIKQQIAFYRRVITPEETQRGLTIYNLQLQPTDNPNQYTLLLILAQPGYHRALIEGDVEVEVTGVDKSKEGEKESAPQKQTLHLADISTESQLHFRFTYFQTLEIPVHFPAMFNVESIEVSAKTQGNIIQRDHLKKIWSELILD